MIKISQNMEVTQYVEDCILIKFTVVLTEITWFTLQEE